MSKSGPRLRIAVVGTGISGLSAAWLLSRRHEVVVYERVDRIGGHCNTVFVPLPEGETPVDTGFIVFNPQTYPNFVELLKALGVQSEASDMSFAVSLDGGGLEYSSAGPLGLFAQPANFIRPRFFGMLADLTRFYRRAPRDLGRMDERLSLSEYLASGGYGRAFRDWHILPMASAIWSARPREIAAFPAAAFIRFFDNHGLLKLVGRPLWRTIRGGAVEYVSRIGFSLGERIRYRAQVARVERTETGATVIEAHGERDAFDAVVLACHADEALELIDRPTMEERTLLGAFPYSRNFAVLHSDPSLMPKRRGAWASWNFIGGEERSYGPISVTYWMNRLQNLPTRTDLFVSLNPPRPPREETVVASEACDHPLFDARAIEAQKRLWTLQGVRNVWFCGAYFGAGFHEDALQAGLAVAEQLGRVKRPWRVANESGRIFLTERAARAALEPAE